MREANFERIVRAVQSRDVSLVFRRFDGSVSVTKDVNTFDLIVAKLGLGAIIGVYDNMCPDEWIEDDLTHAGYCPSG